MITNSYSIEVNKYVKGVPVEYGIKFNNGAQFSAIFDSEEVANLGAQFYELVNYNMNLWMQLFPATLRMWGIKNAWSRI